MVVRRKDPLRTENDLYLTPGWMVDHLMREGVARTLQDDYDISPPLLLEPCVGTGRIVQQTKLWVPDARWITNDIDRSFEADTYEDATTDAYWQRFGTTEERPDWVISNPPFSDAFDIVIRAYEVAKFAVAMLLRITWPEPTEERGDWLEEHPPTWEIKMRRWKFQRSSKSQDNATACWFVWIKDPNAGPQRIIIRRGMGVQPKLGELAL